MTNLLSTISGQFSKPLIIGALFPVVVFLTLNMFFVMPQFPIDWTRPGWVKTSETEWDILVLTFIAIVLSGLLYLFNIPIIRLYEGYPWKDSWIGTCRTKHYKRDFDAFQYRWKGMRTLLRALAEDNPYRSIIEEQWQNNGKSLRGFPGRKELVLPTKLGNVIRNFEYYPNDQYGIDSVELWPRLIDKISPSYASVIDDSMTSFNFMINISFLFTILALETVAIGLLNPTALSPLNIGGLLIPLQWLLTITVFIAASFFFYHVSIFCASAWGATVKGAFDLFRWDLLDQLGYKQKPATCEEESEIWDSISRRMIYGISPTQPTLNYSSAVSKDTQNAPTTPFARSEPEGIGLEVTSGIEMRGKGEIVKVIRVRNIDQQGKTAKSVILTDRLPDGYSYVWDAAYAEGRRVFVSGTNPYQFELGALENKEMIILKYAVIHE